MVGKIHWSITCFLSEMGSCLSWSISNRSQLKIFAFPLASPPPPASVFYFTTTGDIFPSYNRKQFRNRLNHNNRNLEEGGGGGEEEKKESKEGRKEGKKEAAREGSKEGEEKES